MSEKIQKRKDRFERNETEELAREWKLKSQMRNEVNTECGEEILGFGENSVAGRLRERDGRVGDR